MDGNIYAVYNPGHNVDNEQQILEDLLGILINNNNNREGEDKILARIGLANSYTEFVVHHILARQKNWHVLVNNRNKRAHLHKALLRFKG
jgi:hypothetical protein